MKKAFMAFVCPVNSWMEGRIAMNVCPFISKLFKFVIQPFVMYKIPVLVYCSLISIVGFAQYKDSVMIKRIADEVMSHGKAYDNLNYLCKKIGPRLSGSEQAATAVTATVNMLKAAGADTVYLQPCMVPHWIRGEKETGFITNSKGLKHELHLCALGNAVGTGKQGVAGTVVEVNSFKQLEELGETGIKGKIVFFNFPMNPTYFWTFRAYGESGKSRTQGPAKAARYGAIGVLVRSLTGNADDYPHTGVTVYNDSFPKIPAVAISTNDADWLSRELKDDHGVNGFFRTNCKMLPDEPSFNVVGVLKGTSIPNEVITVGGHLDSWDLAEGANDDGAGIVQSIEVLRAFKAVGFHPQRTLQVVMFMNEENGARGAKAYFEHAKADDAKYIMALESDEGGFTPRGFSTEMSAKQKAKMLQWKDLFFDYGLYDFSKDGSGSDIAPLKELGTALVALSPDSQRYFDIHHAATDVFENVSKRELHLGAVNMAALIYLVDKYGL